MRLMIAVVLSLCAATAAATSTTRLCASGSTVGNSGSSETQLSPSSGCVVPHLNLGTNGDVIHIMASGHVEAAVLGTRRIRVEWGGQEIYDTGSSTITLSDTEWTLDGWCMRLSASSQRCVVELRTPGGLLDGTQHVDTTLDLVNDDNEVVLYGTGNSSDQVVLRVFRLTMEQG